MWVVSAIHGNVVFTSFINGSGGWASSRVGCRGLTNDIANDAAVAGLIGLHCGCIAARRSGDT
jgi:hypothetical protein